VCRTVIVGHYKKPHHQEMTRYWVSEIFFKKWCVGAQPGVSFACLNERTRIEEFLRNDSMSGPPGRSGLRRLSLLTCSYLLLTYPYLFNDISIPTDNDI